ncbi:hypothetical protein Trydic_g21141 [Trypoxylus dichotomus]
MVALLAWLEDRKFIVRVREDRSEKRVVREGLPQDSPLSPILCNVYVKGILQFQGIAGLYTFQFADDMAILELESLATHADQWNIKNNETKMEIIAFGKKIPEERRISRRNKILSKAYKKESRALLGEETPLLLQLRMRIFNGKKYDAQGAPKRKKNHSKRSSDTSQTMRGSPVVHQKRL